MNLWREKEPKDWSCTDYVDYIKDIGIDSFYYGFFNVGLEGFRCPSVDLSRVWAIEQGFNLHRCKAHDGLKHSRLETGRDFPTATWRCPEEGYRDKAIGIAQIPHRYDYSKGNYIPITFDINDDINDKRAGLELIWKVARKARIWHTEMSVFDNKFRNTSIFPDKILDKWNDRGRAEKLDRVLGCSLRIEFDTTKEKIGEINGVPKYGRRDFMEEGDKVISSAQKIIDYMNGEMYEKFGFNRDDFEWYWSGNGLYIVTRRGIYCEDIRSRHKIWKEWSRQKFYNYIWNLWNDYALKLEKKIRDQEIKYVNVDYKTQFLRSYIKTPFSLHRTYDRVTLPITSMFKGNGNIDLNSSWWRKYTEARNITRNFVEKTEVNING